MRRRVCQQSVGRGAARVAAEAAEQAGMLLLAQWFVETVQAVTKDVDFFKFAAHIHEVNESWQKAIGCWEQVKKLAPTTRTPTGRSMPCRPPARSSGPAWKTTWINGRPRRPRPRRAGRGRSRPSSSGSSKNSSRRSSGWSRRSWPTRPPCTPMSTLADIYKKHGDLDKAEKVLAKGRKANPDDHGLASIYEDTQISRLRKARDSQQQRVQQYPEDTAAKAKLDQLNEMLNKYEVEAFRRRVQLHPEDCEAAFRPGRDPGASRRP